MIYEDFVNAIGECVKDTDKLPTMVDTLTTAYKEMCDANNAYKTQTEELQTKINQLRDDNTKLVLKSLHTVEVPEIKEETRTERVQQYTTTFFSNEE